MRWIRFTDITQSDALVNADRINNLGVDVARKKLVIDSFYIEVPLSTRAAKSDVITIITDALAKHPLDNSVIDLRYLSQD